MRVLARRRCSLCKRLLWPGSSWKRKRKRNLFCAFTAAAVGAQLELKLLVCCSCRCSCSCSGAGERAVFGRRSLTRKRVRFHLWPRLLRIRNTNKARVVLSQSTLEARFGFGFGFAFSLFPFSLKLNQAQLEYSVCCCCVAQPAPMSASNPSLVALARFNTTQPNTREWKRRERRYSIDLRQPLEWRQDEQRVFSGRGVQEREEKHLINPATATLATTNTVAVTVSNCGANSSS